MPRGGYKGVRGLGGKGVDSEVCPGGGTRAVRGGRGVGGVGLESADWGVGLTREVVLTD